MLSSSGAAWAGDGVHSWTSSGSMQQQRSALQAAGTALQAGRMCSSSEVPRLSLALHCQPRHWLCQPARRVWRLWPLSSAVRRQLGRAAAHLLWHLRVPEAGHGIALEGGLLQHHLHAQVASSVQPPAPACICKVAVCSTGGRSQAVEHALPRGSLSLPACCCKGPGCSRRHSSRAGP